MNMLKIKLLLSDSKQIIFSFKEIFYEKITTFVTGSAFNNNKGVNLRLQQ